MKKVCSKCLIEKNLDCFNKNSKLDYNKECIRNNYHIKIWRKILESSLLRMGKQKEGKTIDLLGYSALELKNHISSLFTESMSWNNYGEWHIDHIIPYPNFLRILRFML